MEYLEEINMWVKWEKYAIEDNIKFFCMVL